MSEGRAFLVTRPDGRFVDASPEALELFGVDLERLRSMRVGDFTAPSQRDTVRDAYRSLVTGAEEGYAGEADITRPDGTSLRVRFRTGRHPGRPGHFVSVVSSAGPPRDAVTVRTGAQVLAEWRGPSGTWSASSRTQPSIEKRRAAWRPYAPSTRR